MPGERLRGICHDAYAEARAAGHADNRAGLGTRRWTAIDEYFPPPMLRPSGAKRITQKTKRACGERPRRSSSLP